jgi:hypothetical protein
MDAIAHFAFGLWLYTKFHSPIVLPLSVVIDLDHVFGFLYDKRKSKVIEIPSLLYLAYRPRSWLHSITGLLAISLPLLPIFGSQAVFIPLAAHLLIDMADRAGIKILPPLINNRIKGILPASYLPEDATTIKRHKRSHVPSVALTVASLILIFLKI